MKYKELYKKVSATISEIAYSNDSDELIHQILEKLVSQYGNDLGITGGRLYAKKDCQYCVIQQIGERIPELDGKCFPMEHLPIRLLQEDKYIIMDSRDFKVNSQHEPGSPLDTFAAIAIGDNDEYIVSFSISDAHDRLHLHYSLNTIRFVTNFKLKELAMKNEFLKAREIQLSLLPSYKIQLNTFEIHGKTRPADFVGGDAYDFLKINDDTWGIAVLDAVGHGLPASLQARDAITGLRMGLAGNIKIDSMMMRLNQVIHKSNLSSRFVSLFYGELEEYGHFVYTNAGHPPPLFFTREGIFELQRGGMVLGPNPQAVYRRGFAFFTPGDILVIFSDGITEARNSNEDQFGLDRLKKLIQENRNLSASDLIEKTFKAVDEFTGSINPEDDQTVVIIKRIEGAAERF